MKQEINPQESNRAEAFSMWMSSPMPMVTLVKTFDVTRLVKVCKKSGVKFNVLLCWCIAKAASQIDEFFLLPQNDKLLRYDKLAVNVVVQNVKGGICLCDVPYSDNISQFNTDYLELTCRASETCRNTSLEDYMIIGTSALPQTELDCIVNQFFWPLEQSVPCLGQVSQRAVQNHIAYQSSVSPRSDGWCSYLPFLGQLAG